MSLLQTRLSAICKALPEVNLAGIQRGIEKESLRVTPDGTLAQTPHGSTLGSALTHPEITTDYSEALLEFITPPFSSSTDVLTRLDNIHRYTYSQIGSERLWVNSMPCMLQRDADIPVGQYGDSNIGKMKTIYRLGLGHRYGRSMQAIAGIHYNFSLPDEFWQFFHQQEQSTLSLQDFKTERYFDLIRNFRRYFWLLLYLFGAAPAVCRSFVASRQHELIPFGQDDHSLHTPHATSLRMGDLGYQSDAQQSLFVCYNKLNTYIGALCKAITQPYPEYESIGAKDTNGHYQQLNTGVLQIENEFYSPVRPKRTAQRDETALSALFSRGVEYIEVRCLDLNPFLPLGIDETQIHFLDTFLMYCLLEKSPNTSVEEYSHIQENQQRMVYHGRDAQLQLLNGSGDRSVTGWGGKIIDDMQCIAKLLDSANGGSAHQQSLIEQKQKLDDPSLTPSAKILQAMQDKELTFFQFAMQQAQEHAEYFRSRPLDPEINFHYQKMATDSLLAQKQIEQDDSINFENYLAQFYAQYQCGSSNDCD